MGKRIILIDDVETTNYVSYYGLGLGNDIYLLKSLESMPQDQKNQILTLGPGDGVLLVGAEPFKYLQSFYHFGIRGENYFDCSKLARLSIEGGSFAKVLIDPPSQEEVQYFMSDSFAAPNDFSWFKQKVLHTYEECCNLLNYMDSLPMDTVYGFDYEASGMPLDKWFELSGASICTVQFGGFISFTDLRHTSTEEQYKDVLDRLGKFLVKRMDKIWTYNMQYEFQVSNRMLGVDLYNLCDAGVFNILDGYHEQKKYSLKWTANRILGTTVWDTEFDRISDLIDSMLFETVGKLKKDKRKELKVTKDNYKNTPEWQELVKRYPKYEKEFTELIEEYWGNPFMCIPSDILGYYCNLDAFYTLMIYWQSKDKYTEKAISVFLDNLRLACRLHSCGIPKWEEYHKEYGEFCKQQMAWGITYCAEARCRIKMYKHQMKKANIDKYNPICQKLLKDGFFFNGNVVDIVKYLLTSNLDTMDTYDTGINEGSLLMTYGSEFAEKFMEIVRDSMTEVKMKTKIDDTITRKKKILGVIGEKLSAYLGIDKLKIGNKHIELEKYLYYERAYQELMNISSTQLNDPLNIPDHIYAFGKNMDLLEYSDYVSDNFFKCKSPIENDEICYELAKLYSVQSCFLAALTDSVQQMDGGNKFYENRGITEVEDGYNHFYQQWSNYEQGNGPGDYPEKIFELAKQFYTNLKADEVKEVWSNFNGYAIQEQFFPNVKDKFKEYEEPFKEDDLQYNFKFITKLVLAYLQYKKHAKMYSTYIKGLFEQTDKLVIENPENHVMIREAEPGEPGAVIRMSPKFLCMEKSSKRWSSGYHTIISHSDVKSTIRAYPDGGHLLSYFDISSAEVKSAGFASGDPGLIEMFKNGIDVYIATAKIYLGEEGWNKMSKGEQKGWRKKFKTIFLGILYGLGKQNLANQLNCTIDEAERVIQAVYNAYPKLREYVAGQQQKPLLPDRFGELGNVNTFFGDRLHLREYDLWLKTTNSYEKKNLEARIKRLGVNLPIQGGTSTAMASGFFNDLRVAKENNWTLTSFITVHDSNTCDFPADKLWDMRPFYDKNFTDYCYEMTGIKLLFDILIGVTYQDACEAKQIDKDTVELVGNARSHLMILDELDKCKCRGLNYEINVPRESIIPNYIEDPMDRFMREKGCSMVMDISKYKIQYKRI